MVLSLSHHLLPSQLLVNEVLSTDITDKELKALRNARWDKAFKELDEDRNRRATIVIEHLIQVRNIVLTTRRLLSCVCVADSWVFLS
jgi:hypothetical protein